MCNKTDTQVTPQITALMQLTLARIHMKTYISWLPALKFALFHFKSVLLFLKPEQDYHTTVRRSLQKLNIAYLQTYPPFSPKKKILLNYKPTVGPLKWL